MPQFLMSNARPPFSDWVAQIERTLARRGHNVTIDRTSPLMLSCYNVNIPPVEIADTWEEYFG